jgi:hypothetical protein
MGRMILTVLGMVAEMELGFIRDRQRAGIDAAKAKGVYKGRPATFDRARIVSLRKEGMGATAPEVSRTAWKGLRLCQLPHRIFETVSVSVDPWTTLKLSHETELAPTRGRSGYERPTMTARACSSSWRPNKKFAKPRIPVVLVTPNTGRR